MHVLEVGEVLAVLPIESLENSNEVDKERIAASAGEECVGAGCDDVRLASERNLGIRDDRRPDGLALTSLRPGRLVHGRSLPPILGLTEHDAEADIGFGVTVVVDVDPVHGARVEGVSYRECVGVQDQDRSRAIGRRLEGKKIGEVEARIVRRRSEPQACEVI
jgi:hypothetical protein